jgi:thiamine pyrophosphate-dependent acetolactate synthase large subunit-like protein
MHHKSSDRQGINPLILVTISVATPAHSTSIQQFQGVGRRSPAVRAQNPPNKLEVGLAKGYGVEGVRAATANHLKQALAAALGSQAPTLIEVPTLAEGV